MLNSKVKTTDQDFLRRIRCLLDVTLTQVPPKIADEIVSIVIDLIDERLDDKIWKG